MVDKDFYIIDTANKAAVHRVTGAAEAHQLMRGRHTRPVIAIRRRVLKKALKANWW